MVLPSRLSGRGESAFLLILGGKPTGLRTVILSSNAALFDRSCGVVGLFMVRILGVPGGFAANYRSASASQAKQVALHCCLPSGALPEVAPGGDGSGRAVAGHGGQLRDRMRPDVAGGENAGNRGPHHDVGVDVPG